MKAPAKLGLQGAKTRFDELQAVHQLQAYATHFVVRVLSLFAHLFYANTYSSCVIQS